MGSGREVAISLDGVRDKNLMQLKKLNTTLFPVRYNDKYYAVALASADFTKLDASRRDDSNGIKIIKIGVKTSLVELAEVRRKSRRKNQSAGKVAGEEDATSAAESSTLEGDVPGEDISEQSLSEEACVEASERDYNGGTNERVPESHRKEVKRRVQRRGLKKEVTEVMEEIPADDGRGQNPEVALLSAFIATRRDKKNCPRNKAQDQSSKAATTAMMAVDESDVLKEYSVMFWRNILSRLVVNGSG
ncbi:acyl-CoA N-acyltransferases (NAT) superfamily protein [Actinidia rufa]|uniref:Acyl-CoA N-acyltransferases (NAT) superfamily protein n=1 Tax=Actinidia rufa TaxID=165716 RepID=A0A7J0DJB2_9ERIC|nr:acyl-CoA N-acyltransferases (NAT) superfamily protein [Actinidia rufa]